ncbi:MAG: acyl-CoA dehydrogenase [Zhongshania sp.]|uniref:acyl-CoA dehydrogenase n=1 Tax=Zhongshania sp. TaxID=1971902 RepID=UPI002634DB85|nr:acyl-CoA dehydrogenase [Zhongshania sp.]MDF1693158.1 acyl-CoA dehydrogenase [Zhongshania sp.]
MYQHNSDDSSFVLKNLISIADLERSPAFASAGFDLDSLLAINSEAGKLASADLANCNRDADAQGTRFVDGEVLVPRSIVDAIRALGAGGWLGLRTAVNYGGQGLPELVNTLAMENWAAANLSVTMHVILSIGSAMAIQSHGTEQQKHCYLPKLANGEWSGVMALTEPQAGSDLAGVATAAKPESDYYRIKGQKSFISWGEHQVSNNIIHLVLARLPNAPLGTKGISLFIVPKFLADEEGKYTIRNDIKCIAVEKKLGLHCSPTCVMSYGDNEGAVGYLIGEENRGLNCMFTMMNEARLKVGVQALGASEVAYQASLAYANSRKQGKFLVVHPDVKRMLLIQKSLIDAMRTIAYTEAVRIDCAEIKNSALEQARVNLMIPIVKAWFTEVAQEICGMAVQIHGGLGYVEETGVAQYLRDIRVSTIYEGTNGIQSEDLVMRKIVRDRGEAIDALFAEIRDTVADARSDNNCHAERVAAAISTLQLRVRCLLAKTDNENIALANSFDLMMSLGYLCGAWASLRMLNTCSRRRELGRRVDVAKFYIDRILPRIHGHVIDMSEPSWLGTEL